MTRCRILFAVWAAACVTALGTAGGAQAAPCAQSLVDASGITWTQTPNLTVGGIPPFVNVYGLPFVSGPPPVAWPGPAGPTCDSEGGGRELTWPATAFPAPAPAGLLLTKKLYVPADAPAFARMVDTYTNATATPMTVNPVNFNVGMANSPFTRQTSSGDTAATVADDWAVLANNIAPAVPTLPVLGEIWQHSGQTGGRATGLFGPLLAPWASPSLSNGVAFDGVTIPAGSSRSFMHVFVMRPGTADGLNSVLADTPALAAGPSRLYEGLSQAEQATLVNWPQLDEDGDGKAFSQDNCKTVANPDQTDTDGDGQGNACDADDDNDGLPDALEASLGSDPLKVDSDGDGKTDGTDACLKLAAATGDGCPAFVTSQVTPLDSIDPTLGLSGFKKSLKRAAFLKGVAGSVACDEPCSVQAELFGSAKSVRLARNEVRLGSKSLPLAAGQRKFTIKPSKKLVGRAKKMTVLLRVTATDSTGNTTSKTQTIKVK